MFQVAQTKKIHKAWSFQHLSGSYKIFWKKALRDPNGCVGGPRSWLSVTFLVQSTQAGPESRCHCLRNIKSLVFNRSKKNPSKRCQFQEGFKIPNRVERHVFRELPKQKLTIFGGSKFVTLNKCGMIHLIDWKGSLLDQTWDVLPFLKSFDGHR
jgi:hypothetical protein